MKVFSALWVEIPARLKLRVAVAGIPSVAEEILSLPSAERVALLTALDAPDAPDALIRRTALVRAYIDQNLGGIPEERALEVELAASIRLNTGDLVMLMETTEPAVVRKTSDARPNAKQQADVDDETDTSAVPIAPATPAETAECAVPTSPIPSPVAVPQLLVPPVVEKTPPVAKKTPADRAREVYENALAAANADTPARKPERIVPRPVVAEKCNGVSLEVHKRLRAAHVVMTVAQLDGLLRDGRCFITGRLFNDGDKITLVNHKLLANYELVKEFGRNNGWSWISVPLAKDCLADWENFSAGVLKKEKAEERLEILRERLEKEDGRRKDSNISVDDRISAYFCCHLLKVAILLESRGIKQAADDEDRTGRAVDEENAHAVLVESLRTKYTTRALIKERQKVISDRHVEIKKALAELETSLISAEQNGALREDLKNERDRLGKEFEIISGFWGELPEEERPADAFHVRDSVRNVPKVRSPGKTKRERESKKGFAPAGSDPSTKETVTPGDRSGARTDAEKTAADAKAERKLRSAAILQRRNDANYGATKKGDSSEKKGKSASSGKSGDDARRAAKKAVRHHH